MARPRRRRRSVRIAALVTIIPLILAVGAVVVFWSTATVNTADEVRFERPLAIPPLAPSQIDEGGRRVFDLSIQTGRTNFTGAGDTDTWGVNGAHLGPTLRAHRGEHVLVNATNTLPEATTLHGTGCICPPPWTADRTR